MNRATVFPGLSSVDGYVDRIMERSSQRNWGFTESQADDLRRSLNNHRGPLLPTSVRIWLGGDFYPNLDEKLLWLEECCVAQRLVARDTVSYEFKIEFRAGSELSGLPAMTACCLDLETLRSPSKTLRRIIRTRSQWPGLELLDFLNLNPGFIQMVSDDQSGGIAIPGLIVRIPHPAVLGNYPDGVVYIRFDVGTKTLYFGHAVDSRWRGSTIASFPEDKS